MSPNRMATASSMALVEELLQSVQIISATGEEVKSHKKNCWNLARRIRLLAPLFEEIRDVKSPLPPAAVVKFQELRNAFAKAKTIIEECRDRSRMYMILEREAITQRFLSITSDLSRALDGLPLNLLAVSDEIQEQAELVQAQLKRAKNLEDTQEEVLQNYLKGILDENKGDSFDTVMDGLVMRLNFNSIPCVAKEIELLHKEKVTAIESGASTVEITQAISLLRRLRTSLGGSDEDSEFRDASGMASSSSTNPVINAANPPDDFRCPISLEVMRDPVIVSTGQTYDRVYIEQWLKEGHKTCPKTQQVLVNQVLIPNYSLRSLIQQWCDQNGVELPKKSSKSASRLGSQNSSSADSGDRALVLALKERILSDSVEIQRTAAAELRMLAKRSMANRVLIAEAGIIPHLVKLLSFPDPKTQEHAVTAILNLSINDINKGAIVSAGAIEPVIKLLKTGTMEARENSAATIFSLSVIDENKISIGQSGAIPPLVDLLQQATTTRGKKDAATALFNLSIYQGNKARAVRAGIIEPLMELLVNRSAGMVDEALAIIASLVGSPEGRNAIGQANAVPILVDLIMNGSSRNKENAASVLLSLCQNCVDHTVRAIELNASGPLASLLRNGTPRAKRKASQLLHHLEEYELLEKSS